MNYRKVTPKYLDELTELFDAYRMFYRKTTDIEKREKYSNRK